MRKRIPVFTALGVAVLAGTALAGSGGVSKTSMKIYVQQKLYDKAIAQGMMALAADPNDGDTNYFLGVAYFSKDNELKPESATYADSSEIFLAKAFEYFARAKELAPKDWSKSADDNIVSMFGRHYNRGVIAAKKNENTTAAVEYRLATIADPENYQGYYAHAAALWPLAMDAKKKDDEAKFTEMANVAIKDLDKVLELKPAEKEKIVAVHQTRGEILWRLGRKQESQEAFAQAVELDPENYEMLGTLGGRFLDGGDLENAAKYLAMCLEVQKNINALDADDADTYRILGGVYVKLQRWDEALAAYNSALELRPDDAGVIYDVAAARCKYGDALEKDGKTADANAQYTEGVKAITSLIQSRDPKPEYYQVLAFCKSRLKDAAGAAIALKRAEELRGKSN